MPMSQQGITSNTTAVQVAERGAGVAAGQYTGESAGPAWPQDSILGRARGRRTLRGGALLLVMCGINATDADVYCIIGSMLCFQNTYMGQL